MAVMQSEIDAPTELGEYWVDEEWQKDYVFAYIQETFCQGSDTFVCAAFYDPSAN